MTYYGAGVVAFIIAILTGLTLKEPERQAIGEDANVTETDKKKISLWKVIIDPRIIMLCLAASIRHCGNCYERFY